MPKNGEVFQEKLALYSAPTLIGMKTASLFRIRKEDIPNYEECLHYFNEGLLKYGIQIRLLSQSKDSILIYIYHHHRLESILSNSLVQEILKRYDYPKYNSENVLNHLTARLLEDEFPHEIGFFLGYPLYDVIGFMDKRQDCKLVGQWKVYGNVKNSKKTFHRYDSCTKMVQNKISKGESIFELVERTGLAA